MTQLLTGSKFPSTVLVEQPCVLLRIRVSWPQPYLHHYMMHYPHRHQPTRPACVGLTAKCCLTPKVDGSVDRSSRQRSSSRSRVCFSQGCSTRTVEGNFDPVSNCVMVWWLGFYLTQCINQMVLESQLPHKIVISLVTITLVHSNLTILWSS